MFYISSIWWATLILATCFQAAATRLHSHNIQAWGLPIHLTRLAWWMGRALPLTLPLAFFPPLYYSILHYAGPYVGGLLATILGGLAFRFFVYRLLIHCFGHAGLAGLFLAPTIIFLRDSRILSHGINYELAHAFQHYDFAHQTNLTAEMLFTPDSMILPILPFFSNITELYHRHNLHSLAYCEVELMLAILQPAGISDSLIQSYPYKLPGTFCNHRTETPELRKANPNVSNDLITDLLSIRSELARAILASQYMLMPLLDQIANAVSGLYDAARSIEAGLIGSSNFFSSPCPSKENADLLRFYHPTLASIYCHDLRLYVPQWAVISLRQLFGNAEIRKVQDKARLLHRCINIAYYNLPDALLAAVSLPENFWRLVFTLDVLPQLFPLDDSSIELNRGKNAAARIELKQIGLEDRDAIAFHHAKKAFLERIKEMLKVSIVSNNNLYGHSTSPNTSEQGNSADRNLSSLSLEFINLAFGSHQPKDLLDWRILLAAIQGSSNGQAFLRASLLYTVWIERGAAVHDTTQGWCWEEWEKLKDNKNLDAQVYEALTAVKEAGRTMVLPTDKRE